MVETAEADIVGSTVAADNPLAALNEIMFELEHLLAGGTSASLHQRNDGVGDFARTLGVVLLVEPLCGESLDFVGAVSTVKKRAHLNIEACTELVVGEGHTHAELTEVLEEAVGPCGTVAILVCGIRSRGHRT